MNSNKLWIPSPNYFFIFGFFYYIISPLFSLFFLDGKHYLITAATKYISLDFFNIAYLLDSIVILTSWYVGYRLGYAKKRIRLFYLDRMTNFRKSPRILFVLFIIWIVLLILKSIASGTIFFVGYTKGYNILVLGPLATTLFTSVWLTNFYSRKNIKKLFFILFIICSIAMLGLGSRMFFVLGTISLLLGLISKQKYILRKISFYIFLVIMLILVLFIGVWRSGGGFNVEHLVTIFFIEPLFTATTTSCYFDNLGGRPIISFPYDIVASFVNFMPSIIFPEKMSLIGQISSDPNRCSPFGASAILGNIYYNFGVLYPIYFIIVGAFYGYLRKRAFLSKFYYATYLSLLPILMFHFYREGFITVIKLLVFNSFIFPFMMLFIIYLIFKKRKKACTQL